MRQPSNIITARRLSNITQTRSCNRINRKKAMLNNKRITTSRAVIVIITQDVVIVMPDLDNAAPPPGKIPTAAVAVTTVKGQGLLTKVNTENPFT